MPQSFVDTHVHVWNLDGGGPFGVTYPWLSSGPLHRTHTLDEIAGDLAVTGVSDVVLVQASDSLAETDELLRVARAAPVPAAVVGWLPLGDAARAEAELDARGDARLVGVRHLIHDEPDREWMLRPAVADGMSVLERRGLAFDAVAERPDLLAQVPVVARRHQGLAVVLDHIGKPPVASGWTSTESRDWADLLRAAAAPPNVVAKLSGLATVSRQGWDAADWQPFVDHALECFGPDRLMLGSDWPVSTLNGTYTTVVSALLTAIGGLSADEQREIRTGTARRTYGAAA